MEQDNQPTQSTSTNPIPAQSQQPNGQPNMVPINTNSPPTKSGNKALKVVFIILGCVVGIVIILIVIGLAFPNKSNKQTSSNGNGNNISEDCLNIALPSGFTATSANGSCDLHYSATNSGKETRLEIFASSDKGLSHSTTGNEKEETVTVAGQSVSRRIDDFRMSLTPKAGSPTIMYEINYPAGVLLKHKQPLGEDHLEMDFTLLTNDGQIPTDQQVKDFTATVDNIVSSLQLK